MTMTTLLLFLFLQSADTDHEITAALDNGRDLFYKSVDDERYLQPCLDVFESLKDHPEYSGRALTYIGALTALKGKHAFWPMQKYKLTLSGLEIMDKGVNKSPEDIEALFIHGMTCYYLPFFFHRAQDARQKFKKIVALLPDNMNQYDPKVVNNVIDFIKTNVKLDAKSQKIIESIKYAG